MILPWFVSRVVSLAVLMAEVNDPLRGSRFGQVAMRWTLALFPASFVFSMTYPSALFLAAIQLVVVYCWSSRNTRQCEWLRSFQLIARLKPLAIGIRRHERHR